MFEIRIHGRGGQGVVTAAELMSIAAFLQGEYSQAFPTFGSERMGAPVTAFCRISEKSIRSRDPVLQPDALIIQDPTLLHHVPVFEGLPSSAYVLINSARTFHELGLEDIVQKITPARCVTVPATQLALEHVGRPLPNAALLGAFAAVTGRLQIKFVETAIKGRFSGRTGEANAAAARAAYDLVLQKEVTHAQAS
jgi:pyruvate ferredoxin oxidoreductase gamma subunit